MKIPRAELQQCIGKAKEISEAYQLLIPAGRGTSKRSIDVLVEVCQESSGLLIEICKVDLDLADQWLYGACLLYQTKAVILHAHYLNQCWERFTVCKELFHVVLDKDEYRTTDIYQHLEDIILAFPDDNSTPTKPVMCEFLAEVAAMEFMLPYHDRAQIIASGQMSAMQVAQEYKIPCLLVERYLSKGFMEILKM